MSRRRRSALGLALLGEEEGGDDGKQVVGYYGGYAKKTRGEYYYYYFVVIRWILGKSQRSATHLMGWLSDVLVPRARRFFGAAPARGGCGCGWGIWDAMALLSSCSSWCRSAVVSVSSDADASGQPFLASKTGCVSCGLRRCCCCCCCCCCCWWWWWCKVERVERVERRSAAHQSWLWTVVAWYMRMSRAWLGSCMLSGT